MQIISGKYARRKLVAPKGSETRPTLARVKESIFSIIQDRIADSCVLDLFAGSGAFAAECASRGAEEVVLVDQSPEAAKAIEKNLKGIDHTLLTLEIDHALSRLKNQNKTFDIIFMDPPYDSDLGFLALRKIAHNKLLKRGGIIIFETTGKNDLPKVPKSYIITKERNYGTAKVIILEQNNE